MYYLMPYRLEAESVAKWLRNIISHATGLPTFASPQSAIFEARWGTLLCLGEKCVCASESVCACFTRVRRGVSSSCLCVSSRLRWNS
jgi:hypothetical protein